MASFFRKRIASKIISLLQRRIDPEVNAAPNHISSKIRVNRFKSQDPELLLPWNTIEKICNEANVSISPKELIRLLRNQGLPTAEGFIDMRLTESPLLNLVFTVDKHVFSKIVLLNICTNEETLASSSCLFEDIEKKNVIVHSRFPAIGEYCQMSHFRTAIYSQFVTNINRFVGHNAVNVSHANDWNLTAAILLTGYRNFKEKSKDSDADFVEVMKASLHQYKNNFRFKEEVDVTQNRLQEGDTTVLSEWLYLKNNCMNYYTSIFEKIGVKFDEVFCDSNSFERLKKVSVDLQGRDIISEEDGSVCINSLDDSEKNTFSGTTANVDAAFYQLSRYLNVVIEMEKKYKFDSMYFVVSSAQKEFLSTFFSVAKILGYPWAESLHPINLKLITDFESKRKKKLYIEDVLNKITNEMMTELHENLQMDLNNNLKEMTQQLGLSSLIIYNMKHKRNDNYRFHLQDIISFKKDTGACFQLCYAGLKGLQEDSEYKFKHDIDMSTLLEPEAHHLIQHLARFDEMVYKSYCFLEPSLMFQYLSSLWYFTDQASNVLKLDIKKDRLIVIKARLLLLSATLKILGLGLDILGITPLEKIYTPEKHFVHNK